MRQRENGTLNHGYGLQTKGMDMQLYPDAVPAVLTSEGEVDSQVAQETGHIAVVLDMEEDGFNKNVSKFRD